MIENNAVKKMVNSILHNRQNTLSDRDIMHPEREWFLGISAGAIILASAIFWSVNTYSQFNNISAPDSGEQEKNALYKAQLVETALTDFTDRKKMYNNLKEDLISKTEKVEIVAPEPGLDLVEKASSTYPKDINLVIPEKKDDIIELTF